MKKLISLLSLLLYITVCFAQTTAITSSSVNLRPTASIDNNVVGVVSQGEIVEITGCDGDALHVSNNCQIVENVIYLIVENDIYPQIGIQS